MNDTGSFGTTGDAAFGGPRFRHAEDDGRLQMALTQTMLFRDVWAVGSLERAACRGADVELFFSVEEEDQQRALEYCSRCEVRQQCLEAAVANREMYGIWGGTRESERRILIRDIRRRDRGAPGRPRGRDAAA